MGRNVHGGGSAQPRTGWHASSIFGLELVMEDQTRHPPRCCTSSSSTKALFACSPLLSLGDSWIWFLGIVSVVTPQGIVAFVSAVSASGKIMQDAIVPLLCFLR